MNSKKRNLVHLRTAGQWILPPVDSDVITDEIARRRIFISILILVAVPLMLWFFWLDDGNGASNTADWFRLPFTLLGSVLLVTLFTLIHKGFTGTMVSRITLLYFTMVALSQVLLDRGEHTLYYLLMLPTAAVFVLGLKEGAIWGIAILIGSLVLLDPVSGFDLANTRTGMVDFIAAYLVMLSFSIGYEALRRRSHSVAEERNRKLGNERKRLIKMQKELLSREEKLRQYASMASDWLLETDASLKLVYVSARFERVTGIRLDEVIGRSIFNLFERYQLCDRGELEHSFKSRESFRDFNYTLDDPDGGKIHVMSRGEPVYDSDGVFTGYLCTNSDISDYVELQEDIRNKDRTLHHVQKLDAIGQLTSSVAHDINNLLTVIKGNLEFMRMSADETWDMEYVNSIESAADQASDLTSKLLSFSKQRPMATGAVDLNEVFEQLGTLIRHSVGEGVSVEMIVSPEVRPCLSDRSQLGSAILNLALNARDAMEGEGKLVITAKNQLVKKGDVGNADIEPGNYVRICVIDEGKGMPQNMVEKVTEPFFTTKALGEGTGLGLSMVYGFVTQSGGKLVIESAEGIGTNMSLVLPQALFGEEEPAAGGGATHTVGEKGLALMVEDEISVQRIVGRMLRLMGYEAIICSSGEEALSVFQDHEPQLLLTDMMLGTGINGMELADRVSDLCPETRILMMSGYPEEILDKRQEHSTSYELLRKPFGYKELSRMLEQLFAEEAIS
ncbi:MAG: response regulator [Pseudomonadales bacterium]|nr:response regulator [Pseudomonadales bacterium]MBO7004281.1 response regulator [Pseudomonadales bacterium]